MKQNMLLGAIAMLALVVGVYLSISLTAPKKPEFAQMYPAPRVLHDVQLQAHDGTQITNSWFEEQWTILFVGYTFCPDICPTTLAELKRIYPALSGLADETPIEVLFLSVDPNRDDVPRLNQYIEFFNPAFTAATAPHKQLFPFVRSLGMAYSMAESTDNPNYLVDHSASVVVINPDAMVVGRFKPHHKPGTAQLAISDGEQILADLPIIMSMH